MGMQLIGLVERCRRYQDDRLSLSKRHQKLLTYPSVLVYLCLSHLFLYAYILFFLNRPITQRIFPSFRSKSWKEQHWFSLLTLLLKLGNVRPQIVMKLNIGLLIYFIFGLNRELAWLLALKAHSFRTEREPSLVGTIEQNKADLVALSAVDRSQITRVQAVSPEKVFILLIEFHKSPTTDFLVS